GVLLGYALCLTDTSIYTLSLHDALPIFHLQDRAGRATPVLEAGGVGWSVEDFAPDDRRLLVSRYESINRSYLYELDLGDGTLTRSEEHTSELQSRENLVCRLLLEKKIRY